MNKGILWLASAIALALSACAVTPEQRIQRDSAAFAQLAPEVQAKAQRGELAIGFDASATRFAVGYPDRITERVTAEGSVQIWQYFTVTAPSLLGGCVGGFAHGYYGLPYRRGVDPYFYAPYYNPVCFEQHYAEQEEYLRITFKDGKISAIDKTSRP